MPADAENLERLAQALDDLQASCIAVPPFADDYLKRGFAIHFRSQHPEAQDMRIDVMSVLRGVAPFDELWQRRTTLEMEGQVPLELMALPDLVKAKKTQRDKDWPMIRRLVEAHYDRHRQNPNPEQVLFWLREAITPTILIEVAGRFPEQAGSATPGRPLLAFAAAQDLEGLAAALEREERDEREADRAYWQPLRAELEQLRRQRRRT